MISIPRSGQDAMVETCPIFGQHPDLELSEQREVFRRENRIIHRHIGTILDGKKKNLIYVMLLHVKHSLTIFKRSHISSKKPSWRRAFREAVGLPRPRHSTSGDARAALLRDFSKSSGIIVGQAGVVGITRHGRWQCFNQSPCPSSSRAR